MTLNYDLLYAVVVKIDGSTQDDHKDKLHFCGLFPSIVACEDYISNYLEKINDGYNKGRCYIVNGASDLNVSNKLEDYNVTYPNILRLKF